MSVKNWDDLSPEQKELAKKALSHARFRLVFSVVKFATSIFFANVVANIIATLYLGTDVEPQTLSIFKFVISVFNALFLMGYLSSMLRKNDEKLSSDLKTIINQ